MSLMSLGKKPTNESRRAPTIPKADMSRKIGRDKLKSPELVEEVLQSALSTVGKKPTPKQAPDPKPTLKDTTRKLTNDDDDAHIPSEKDMKIDKILNSKAATQPVNRKKLFRKTT